MTLREKTVLVERITADKELSKNLCNNFIFDIEDVSTDEEIIDIASIGAVVGDSLNIVRLRCFRIDLASFLKLLLATKNVDVARLIGDNLYKMELVLRVILAVAPCVTVEVKGDDAILMACLFKMNAHKQPVTETAALAYFNDIKRKLKHNPVDTGQFAATVNNLLNLGVIDMEDERILLTEVIIHKNSIDNVLNHQRHDG